MLFFSNEARDFPQQYPARPSAKLSDMGEPCISLGRNTAQSFEQWGNDVSWNFYCRGDSKQSWALRFALSVTFSSGHILDSLLRQNISLWLD